MNRDCGSDSPPTPAPPPSTEETGIRVTSRYLWVFLMFGIPCLSVLSVLMTEVKARADSRMVQELADRFILNTETSLPTVLSFLLMLNAAQFSLLAYSISQRRKKTLLNLYWIAAALILVGLAFDEVAQLHEKVPPVILREQFRHHGWIFAGLGLVSGLILLAVPFLLSLPRPLAKRLLAALCIFFSGAIVMEGIGGFYAVLMGKDFFYSTLTVLEEALELAGMSYLNIVLVDHAAESRLMLRFSNQNGGGRSDR